MKKLIFASVILVTFSSCKSDFDKELDLLHAYIEEHNITTEPTESGLYYIETQEGTGDSPKYGDDITVHYEGRLLNNNEVFDSSYDRGEPSTFTLGLLIDGWNEGLTYMKEGGKATLIIPSNLAYGSYGAGNIPPYSTLIFDVELIEIP